MTTGFEHRPTMSNKMMLVCIAAIVISMTMIICFGDYEDLVPTTGPAYQVIERELMAYQEFYSEEFGDDESCFLSTYGYINEELDAISFPVQGGNDRAWVDIAQLRNDSLYWKHPGDTLFMLIIFRPTEAARAILDSRESAE